MKAYFQVFGLSESMQDTFLHSVYGQINSAMSFYWLLDYSGEAVHLIESLNFLNVSEALVEPIFPCLNSFKIHLCFLRGKGY